MCRAKAQTHIREYLRIAPMQAICLFLHKSLGTPGLEQMPSSCLLCDAAYGIMFVFFRMNNRREFVLKETRCRMIKAEEIEMLIDASDRLVSAVSTDFRRYLGI